MAGNQPSQPPKSSGASDGWLIVSYLFAGMLVWGGIGWIVDRWLDTGGLAVGIGAIVGMAGAIYLVMRRFSP